MTAPIRIEVETAPTIELCRELARMQLKIWEMSEADALPTWKLFIGARLGGTLIVGYSDETPVAHGVFTHAHKNSEELPFLYWDLGGVLPEYRYKGIGERIVIKAQEIARKETYSSIDWTYDPLEGANANLYLRKLGAVIIRYYPNYYGQLSGTRHCGTPTDRFWARLEPGSERRKHNMPALVLHIDEYDSYEDVMANTSQKIAVEIPMVNFSHIISAIDTHTAGEPTRIVVSGVPHISGRTMADKKNYMRERLDYIRTLLTYEPRGHKDMFGVILVPPTTACAHYGVLFVDPTGYLDMCGSGIMAVTTVLLETGMVPMIEPETVIVLDTPAGLIESRAQVTGTQALSVSVANVPSFLWAKDVGLSLPDGRDISIDVAFGGNFFALVSAKALGVELRPENAAQLSEYETLIRNAVNDKIKVKHPEHGHIATVEITDFYDIDAPGHFVKSVAARGHMIDRSPCGTGTSSILATLYGTGKLKIGTEYTSESIIGTRFQGTLIKEVKMADVAAVAPVITGQAYITGLQQFVVDPSDPIKYGFVLS